MPTFILLSFSETGLGEGKEMCEGELVVATGDALDVLAAVFLPDWK